MTYHTHPEELLAGHVEGSLTHDERDLLVGHLTTCETCREEVDLASAARASLAELAEVEVPVGVTRPVMAELERTAGRSRPSRWQSRLAWAGGLAAAASLVALLSLSGLFPFGREDGAAPAAGGAGGAERAGEEALAAAPIPLEKQDVDYDPAIVEELAVSVADDARAAAAAPATAGLESSDAAKFADGAFECLRRGSSLTENDVPVKVIEAKFEGRPAYLGIFLESTAPGEPPDKVVIWIVAKDDCEFLSFAQQRIV